MPKPNKPVIWKSNGLWKCSKHKYINYPIEYGAYIIGHGMSPSNAFRDYESKVISWVSCAHLRWGFSRCN